MSELDQSNQSNQSQQLQQLQLQLRQQENIRDSTNSIQFIEFVESDENIADRLKLEEMAELEKLLNDINTIKEINQMVISMLGEQKEHIKEMESSVVDTTIVLDVGNIQLVEANSYQEAYIYTKGTVTVVGTAIVACLAWPLTITGIHIGSIIAGSATLIGGSVWTLSKS